MIESAFVSLMDRKKQKTYDEVMNRLKQSEYIETYDFHQNYENILN